MPRARSSKRAWRTQVVMLTALEQERLVTDGSRPGAGFVLKTQAGEDLAQAIQQFSRGGFYVGAGVSQAVWMPAAPPRPRTEPADLP